MGKFLVEKKHRKVHRDAGAFHPLEIQEAKSAARSTLQENNTKSDLDEDSPAGLSALSRGQRKRKAKRVQKLRKSTNLLFLSI